MRFANSALQIISAISCAIVLGMKRNPKLFRLLLPPSPHLLSAPHTNDEKTKLTFIEYN